MNKLLTSSKIFMKRNASTILTCVGAVGVVATAVTAVQATPKAIKLIEEKRSEQGGELTKWETIQVAAPVYIPSLLIMATTLTCIFGANILNKRKQASLMSAYALLNQTHRSYRNKVIELHGEEADQEINAEIAKDQYEEEKIELEDPEKKLFYDLFSKQYFESTEADVLEAQYLLNRSLSIRGYASAKEYYDFLGIPSVDGGEEIGWSTGMNSEFYWQEWVDFPQQHTIMEDNLECTIIYMAQEPRLEWQEY